MTIAEKYKNLKNKTIEEMVLEIVEECAQKCENGKGLELVCGWWETDDLPKADSTVFDFMAGECYHKEINEIMKREGFHIYENYGGYRFRARTTYRL